MIKVGFWYDAPAGYTGGANYIGNLLYAASLIKDKDVEFYVFLGKKADESLLSKFRPYAKIIHTAILDRKSFSWFLDRILFKLLKSNLLPEFILRKHGIAVVSHTVALCRRGAPFKTICWIPDFQYLHLPELFPGLNADAETARLKQMVAVSDMALFSSEDALNDFRAIGTADLVSRCRVIPFVSQPDSQLYSKSSLISFPDLQAKYAFNSKFFFLPNQFWTHKNHMVVLEAVRLLKEKGKEILVICTGNLNDYRLNNSDYSDSLKRFISANGLQDNVKILGMIDYPEVLLLMRNALAVINPSRFEGWSSTVEEAKSMGKPVVLSDIKVHIEQNPPGGRFFPPNDYATLSGILEDLWDAHVEDKELAEKAAERLHARTVAYGKNYIGLLRELFPYGK